LVAAAKWIPLDLHDVAAWLAPHRHAWYALPAVMLAFVVLALLPVMLLIAATGIAFGPVLGPVYAMAGCLASASTGFAIGRWLGRKRVEQLGGKRIARVTRGLKRNGTLAVFLVRKVPAPFTLVNIVVGASTVGYREFMIGTLLGMGAMVIALAGFGYQLSLALRSPSPTTVIAAALFLGVPLTLAWLVNRALRSSTEAG
jgi:phospholipase D1/2